MDKKQGKSLNPPRDVPLFLHNLSYTWDHAIHIHSRFLGNAIESPE